MSDNVSMIIVYFIFFGWVPIIAIGKAAAIIIAACRSNK